MFDGISDASLHRLLPGDVRAYAGQRGWHRVENFRDQLAVYVRDGADLDQLLIPITNDLGDYTQLMRLALKKLTETENRPAISILNDIFSVYSDTIRCSVRSSETEKGTVPLESGLELLQGARKALLSAACTVLAPDSLYHPRMSRSPAEKFVQACELGQTEHGSYTVTIRCPLNIGDDAESDTAPNAEPFGRRATATLVDSAIVLASAIDDDRVESLVDGSQHGAPHVTANFCDALLRMQPTTEQSALALSVSWAPSRPRPTRQVLFRSDHFPKIDWLYRQLRPASAPQAAPFIGHVDELRGALGTDGRRYGEVRLTVMSEDEVVKARAELTADQYSTAMKAHMSGDLIVVTGLLERRPRLSVIREILRFEAFEAETTPTALLPKRE